jgi:PKD repeat protein
VQAAGYDFAGPQLLGLSIPAAGVAGIPVSFSVSPLDVFSGVSSTGWSFGDGQSATGTAVSHTYTSAGTYHVSVTATDGDRNQSTATGTITIGLATGTITIGLAPAVTLTSLLVSPRSFTLTGRRVNGHCVKTTAKNRSRPGCRRPTRLRVSFTLSVPLSVTITLEQPLPGRKVNGRCIKPTAKNRKHRTCTRLVNLRGQITLAGKAGANHFTFNGKIGGHRLGPGSYRLTATPTAGASKTTTFHIRR